MPQTIVTTSIETRLEAILDWLEIRQAVIGLHARAGIRAAQRLQDAALALAGDVTGPNLTRMEHAMRDYEVVEVRLW